MQLVKTKCMNPNVKMKMSFLKLLCFSSTIYFKKYIELCMIKSFWAIPVQGEMYYIFHETSILDQIIKGL